MNRAEVGIGARRTSRNRERLIRVERGRFLKLFLDAHNSMRFFVAIDPGNHLPRLHSYGLRIKGEVFDLYCVLLAVCAVGVLRIGSECDGGQIETTDGAEQCDGFVF